MACMDDQELGTRRAVLAGAGAAAVAVTLAGCGGSSHATPPKAAPSFDRAFEMVSAVLNPQPDRSVYGLSA